MWHQSQSPGGPAVTAMPKTLSQRFPGIFMPERQRGGEKKRDKERGRTKERLVLGAISNSNKCWADDDFGASSAYTAQRSRACPRLSVPACFWIQMKTHANVADCHHVRPTPGGNAPVVRPGRGDRGVLSTSKLRLLLTSCFHDSGRWSLCHASVWWKVYGEKADV